MLLSNTRLNLAAVLVLAAVVLALGAPATAQTRSIGAAIGAVQPPTVEEVKWLQFMREEEKLALDVYKALYQKWNLVAFQNIAASEETHFNTIGILLTRYGVSDPVQSAAGVYTDPRLNTLYNELMAKGLNSAQDALLVGVAIERQDITDLESALAATAKYDLKRVFTNLMTGSHNHLEAFETVCAITAN